MRARLMPAFGKFRLDAIDHAHVSAWFDAWSADKPGTANRTFEVLRAMLRTACQWGDLGEHVPDAVSATTSGSGASASTSADAPSRSGRHVR